MTTNTLPCVSIIVPTTNSRLKYMDLLRYNILSQTYPFEKLELIIVGDTDDNTRNAYKNMFPKLEGLKCRYINCDILNNIGSKRNFSCTKASYKIIAMMDDDDIYNRDYIKHSVEEMNRRRVDIVGCRDMLVTWPSLDFEARYVKGVSIHEGTMVFRKKHWKKYKFKESSSGEGVNMKKGAFFNEIDIRRVMICVAHDTNTFDKTCLLDTCIPVNLDDQKKAKLKEILNS